MKLDTPDIVMETGCENIPTGNIPPLSSVAHFEDDYICDSKEEALEYIYRVHAHYGGD